MPVKLQLSHKPLLSSWACQLLIVGLVAAGVWHPLLSDALFVDEAGSVWSARHLSVTSIQGETQFYYQLLARWMAAFGDSERSIRLLSSVCVSLAALLFVVVGQTRKSSSYFYGVSALLLLDPIVFAAVLARPYGLGLLFVMVAFLGITLRNRRLSALWLLGAALSAALSLWCHPTFVFVLPVYAYLIWEGRVWKERPRETCFAVLIFFATALPAFIHAARLHFRSDALSFVTEIPPWPVFVRFFLPSTVLLTFIFVAILQRGRVFHGSMLAPSTRADLKLGLVWFLSVKFATCSAGLLVSPVFLVSRYSTAAGIGQAILIGALINTIANSLLRFIAWFLVVFFLFLPWRDARFSATAWRPIIDYARFFQRQENCQVFAVPGFVEAKSWQLATSAPTAEFLRSPLTYYKLDTTLLPFSAETDSERQFFSHELKELLRSNDCVMLILWNMASLATPGPAEFTRQVSSQGFHLNHHQVAGAVSVWHWQRPTE